MDKLKWTNHVLRVNSPFCIAEKCTSQSDTTAGGGLYLLEESFYTEGKCLSVIFFDSIKAKGKSKQLSQREMLQLR